MFGWLRKQRDSDGFWAWLATNTQRIQTTDQKATASIADELSRVFKNSYPDLVWEITPLKSDPWIFCISADGNRELFDQVKSAVATAPPIPGWQIKAFRQRGSLDAVIKMQDRELGYDDIWCEVEPNGSRISVTLLVRGLTLDSAKTLLGAALILLDNAVGEYDSVMKISELNNGPLPSKPTKSERLFPLSELPGYLDRLNDLAT